jgi:hypothetical protein
VLCTRAIEEEEEVQEQEEAGGHINYTFFLKLHQALTYTSTIPYVHFLTTVWEDATETERKASGKTEAEEKAQPVVTLEHNQLNTTNSILILILNIKRCVPKSSHLRVSRKHEYFDLCRGIENLAFP